MIRTRPNLAIATITMMIAASPIFAVGTVTQAVSPIGRDPGSNPDTRVHQVTINWTADAANGSVPATLVNLGSFPAIQGMRLVSFEAKPGSPAPTNNYTITLTDTAGVDLLAGAGAALSNVNSASLSVPNMQAPIVGGLTFTLTGNVVNSATGSVYIYFAPIAAALTAPGAAGTTTNNTFSGTNTFTGVVAGNPQLTWTPATFGANCTVAALQASITAATATGGTVDYRSCTTISSNITNTTGTVSIPANVIVLLGPSTWTCAITTASTPCWWLKGDGAQLIGAGGGNTFGGGDPSNSASTGVTTLLCSSCGTTTDMVLVENPNRSASFPNFFINSVRLQGLSINMGGSGREGIFTVGSDDGTYQDFKIFENVCSAAPCGGLHVAGGLSTDPQLGQSYRNSFNTFQVLPANANTTGAACFIDARFGEVAYGMGVTNFRCSGNVTNGGGLVGLLIQANASGNVIGSADTLTFDSGYIGNPIAGATSYGVQMECPGNWLAHTGGICFNITFRNILLERIFNSVTGTAFGCTASGTSNGTGCGEIHMDNMSLNFAHWNVDLDNRTTNNPTGAFLVTGVLGSQSGGNPEYVATGSSFGNNAQSYRNEATWTPTANTQTSFGFSNVPNISKGAFTGGSYLHYFADIGDGTYSGTGTLTSLLGFKCNGSFGTIHTSTAEQTNCFQEVGGDPNSFDGPFEFVETTAPAGLAGVDKCYADSTAHSLKCSYNNGTFFNVPLVGTTNTWSANQSFNSGTLLPSAAGGTDVGSTTLPFGNLWLGSSSTSQFKIAPASTTAARIITLPDPGSNANMVLAPCITSQKTETGADANLLTCPIVAATGTYRIRFILDISASNAATLGWTATWTDSNGLAAAPTNLAEYVSGSGTPGLTVTTSSTGELYGSIDVSVNNSATSIVVKLTFSGTSFTAKATATVERIG